MTEPTAIQTVDETAALRLNARWLISMETAGELLEQQSVFISGEGRILAVEPASSERAAAQTLDLNEHVLLPGYVNAHGHAAMALFRGLADDLPLMTWLNDHIWPAEGRWVADDFVEDGTELAIAEMLKGGTTTFADMYFFPQSAAKAVNRSGMRHVNFSSVMDFPTAYGTGPEDYLAKARQAASDFADNPLVTFGLGPHAPYTVSDEPLKAVAALAEELDAPIQIHLHETAFEVSDSEEKHSVRPIKRLFDLGFLSPRVSCVHMTALNEEDMELIRQSGASVVHCPESNLKLASGFCPVANLMALGINLGLGTDGAASNNDLSMQGEMKTAAMLAKAVAGDAAAVPAWQALYMATLGSAKALGLGQQTGSITAGKWADLQAVRLDALEQQPLYDPISQLVYTDSSRHLSHLWVAGQALVSEGSLTRMDEAAVKAKAVAWRERVQSS